MGPAYGKLFLSHYLRKNLLHTKNWCLENTCISSNILRLIDYRRTLKNNTFKNNYNDTYNDDVEPKKENKGPCKALFLDLSIESHDRKFNLSYLLRKDTYVDSYILSKTFYVWIDSDILFNARRKADLINIEIRDNNFSAWMTK